MPFIYRIQTNSGTYVGKDSTGGGGYMRDHHIMGTLRKVLKMESEIEYQPQPGEDIEASTTLEKEGATVVFNQGFRASSFIRGLGVTDAQAVQDTLINSGLGTIPSAHSEGNQNKPLDTIGTGLERVGAQPGFEVAEALSIMLTAKNGKMLNRKVDFLTFPGGNVTVGWAESTALSLEEFLRKAKQTGNVKINEDITLGRTIDSTGKPDNLLKAIIAHPKVQSVLSFRFKKIEQQHFAKPEVYQQWLAQNGITKPTPEMKKLYDSAIKAAEEGRSRDWQNAMRGLATAASASLKGTMNILIDEVQIYQPAVLKGYQQTNGDLGFSNNDTNNLQDYYSKVKNQICKIFQKEYENNKGSDNISASIRSSSAFKNGKFIQDNGDAFYTEQMAIKNETIFGPLVKITEEDSVIKVGRQNLNADRVVTLFTVDAGEGADIQTYDNQNMLIG